MSCPKFCIGDIVNIDYLPQARGEVGGYRIIRLVPDYRGDEPLYRIKSFCEPFERIVRESELTLVARSSANDNDAPFANANPAVPLRKGKSRPPNLQRLGKCMRPGSRGGGST
jgi:hypothetical protein